MHNDCLKSISSHVCYKSIKIVYIKQSREYDIFATKDKLGRSYKYSQMSWKKLQMNRLEEAHNIPNGGW